VGTLRKLKKSIQTSRKPILFVPEDYELDRLIGTVTDGKAAINAIVIRSDTMLEQLREKLSPIIPAEEK
jgi:hypothetical protein